MGETLGAIRHLASHRRGKTTILFLSGLLTLMAAAGCALDYATAIHIQNKLQAAADLASLGSIASTSPGFAFAATMTDDGPIPAGIADATSLFDGNRSGLSGYRLQSLTAAVARNGSALTSRVQFSARIPGLFLGLMGLRPLTVSGLSTATTKLRQVDAAIANAAD